MMPSVPHLRVVVGFCIVAVLGYAAFSVWAIYVSSSEALQGDVGGTWKSFAVAAMAFWLGASSGGKARDMQTPSPPADKQPLDLTGAEEPQNQGEPR